MRSCHTDEHARTHELSWEKLERNTQTYVQADLLASTFHDAVAPCPTSWNRKDVALPPISSLWMQEKQHTFGAKKQTMRKSFKSQCNFISIV